MLSEYLNGEKVYVSDTPRIFLRTSYF